MQKPLLRWAAALSARKPVATPQPDSGVALASQQRDWFRYFYAQHASMERLRLYGVADDRTKIYAEAISEFRPIDDMVERMILPPASDGPVNGGAIYFGSRTCFLKQANSDPLVYAMSYLGSAAWTHGKTPFDTLTDALGREPPKNAGLASQVYREHGASAFTNGAGFFVPLSFNVADTTGDGNDDFWLGGRLVHSSPEGYVLSEARTLAGREVSFISHNGKTWALAPNEGSVEVYDPHDLTSGPAHTLIIDSVLAKDRPYTILPVDQRCSPDGVTRFIAVTDKTLDIYSIDADWLANKSLSLTGIAQWELFIGAVGRFTAATTSDFWVSESRWKNADGLIVGRMSLIEGLRLNETGEHDISDFARTTIIGSRKYTDYDGIGTTLSPEAGDFDGDGIPDLSFSGHRHMSEAGALFILPGSAIKPGRMSVEDPAILKIVGRPVSQVAPYFHHLDIGQRLVVGVDNDLCAGINAGAVYVIKLPQ